MFYVPNLTILESAKMRAGLILVAVLVICMPIVTAQLGPEAGMLGHIVLSPSGIDLPDAVQPYSTSSNPAVLPGLVLLGWGRGVEADIGFIDFDAGPTVTADMELFWWNDGREFYRVMRQGASSGSAPLPLVLNPTTPVSFDTESLQLSFARNEGRWNWGVSWYPENKTTTRLGANNGLLAIGKVDSSLTVRAGLSGQIAKNLYGGAVWHYENSHSTLTMTPLMTGERATTQSAHYQTSLRTYGLLWTLRPGTSAYANFQEGKYHGPGLDENISIWFLGADQFVTPEWSVGISNLDNAWGTNVQYFSEDGKWNAGASYSPNTLRRSEDYLGRADTLYMWGARSF